MQAATLLIKYGLFNKVRNKTDTQETTPSIYIGYQKDLFPL